MLTNRKRSLPLVLAAWLVLCSGLALACSVPVFRYALERWDASPYAFVVFHRGPLSDADKKLIDLVSKSSFDNGGKTNMFIQTVDVSQEMDDFAKSLWAQEDGADLPLTVLRYPLKDMGMPGPVMWRGRLTKELVDLMLDSPARQKIAKQITGGESAVWVYLGDKKQIADTASFEATLKKVQGQVQLPEIDPQDEEWGPGGSPIQDMQKNLKLSFSVVKVDRDDPKEKMFVMNLMRSEPNLEVESAGKPIVFPIFGRGRALRAIVGKGMTEENIGKDAEFLVGPCSCTIKRLNPGVDLLMTADWVLGVQGAMVQDVALPEVTALSEGVTPESIVPVSTTAPAAAIDSGSKSSPKPGTQPAGAKTDVGQQAIVLGIVIVLITIVVAIYARKSSSGTQE